MEELAKRAICRRIKKIGYNWKEEGVGKIARIVLKLFASEGGMGGLLAQTHGSEPVGYAQFQDSGGAVVATNHHNLIPDFATLSFF